MNLVSGSLRRPHSVWVGVFLVAVLGVIAYQRMPTHILPEIKSPTVMIFLSYRGVPTQDMEREITAPLERALGRADFIDHMESRTMVGISLIKVFFQPHIEPGAAASQVLSLVNSEMQNLPPGTQPPTIMTFDASTYPVGNLVVTGTDPGVTEKQLLDYTDNNIREALATIHGLASAPVFGGKPRQIMIYVNPDALHARGLSPMDVVKAVNLQSLVIPTGQLRIGKINYNVLSNSMLPSTRELGDIPLAAADGKIIYLHDVSKVVDSTRIVQNIVRVNGDQAVYMPVLRETGYSAIKLIDELKAFLPRITDRAHLPKTIKVELAFDESTYVREALGGLEREGIAGAGLAALMILVFLGSWRGMLITCLSIPISVLAAFGLLTLANQTINIMTLGGLALVVGRLVDDSIVVVENTFRHLNLGKTPAQAALDSAREIAVPVLMATVTTIVVFAPIALMTGIGKSLFSPLALAASFAMFGSYVVSLTVAPVASARLLRPHQPGSRGFWLFAGFEWAFERFVRAYIWPLRRMMRRKLVVLGLLLLVAGAAVPLYFRIGSELFPEVDTGEFMLHVRAPSGYRPEETARLALDLEATIREVIAPDDLEVVLANVGLSNRWSAMYTPNNGTHAASLRVQLRTGGQGRTTSVAEYISRLRPLLAARFPGLDVFFQTGGIVRAVLDNGAVAPIEVQVSGRSLQATYDVAKDLARRVRPIAGVTDVYIPQRMDYPQLRIEVDRAKAMLLGLTQYDAIKSVITSIVSSAFIAPNIWIDPATGNAYYISVQYEESRLKDINTLRDIPLTADRNSTMPGSSIPLRNVADIVRTQGPVEVFHQDVERTTQVYINAEGGNLGAVARQVERVVQGEALPAGVHVTVKGEVASMRESFANLGSGLLLATLFVYLLMVAQFASWVDPIIMIVAAPLGLVGVIATLWLTGTTLNVQSAMGILMMIGISVSNSVLLVEFANRRLADGLPPAEAAVSAAGIRMRPVLMTSIATVLGLLPMALHLRLGDELNLPLARAVIGGLVGSTLLTLIVVPVLYALVKTRAVRSGPAVEPAGSPAAVPAPLFSKAASHEPVS